MSSERNTRARDAIVSIGRCITDYDGEIPKSPFSVLCFLEHLADYQGDDLREYVAALHDELCAFVKAKAEEQARAVVYEVDPRDLMAVLLTLAEEPPCGCDQCVAEREAQRREVN